MSPTALVISAHSADFVWRAGGAIALHAAAGFEVTVVCLSYGERGESAKLWRQPGMTLERVKAERQKEAEAAAKVLGVHDIQFWDLGDYPITLSNESLFRMVDVMRATHPKFILTHSKEDLYNHDHPAVTDFAQHARVTAQAHGHNPDEKVLGAPPVFLFEPHQPEQCNFQPNVILNIDEAWETKYKAFLCLPAQKHLWAYYERVALNRGVQGGRNSGKNMIYGEAYQRLFPMILDELA